jgi:GTP pyrophosphokinase
MSEKDLARLIANLSAYQEQLRCVLLGQGLAVGERATVEAERVSARIIRTLAYEWMLSDLPQAALAIHAAIVLPYLNLGTHARDRLVERHGSEAVALAEELERWRRRFVLDAHPAHSIGWYMLQRRILYRRAYLDRPLSAYILLLLADHDVALNTAPHSREMPRRVAALTEQVYIPIAEMLGLWRIRRAWIKTIMQLLYVDEYAELADVVLRHSLEWDATAAHLREALLDDAEALGIRRLQIKRIGTSVGTLLNYIKAGTSREEVLSHLSMRVQCQSRDDCYRMLGLIHQRGQAVAPRFAEHFDDYIAAPQLNGYRALHSTIQYLYHPRGSRRHLTPIKLRVTTRLMHQLNEWGCIAAQRAPHEYQDVPAWWQPQIHTRVSKLARRYERSEVHAIDQLLQQHDLTTRSDPLYVFTPRGEIVLLDEGSTALDFAYHIHSRLGHHASQIRVNGQSVAYNLPLQNGDLVQVHDDPHQGGPDLAWLDVAATSYARSQIRRELTLRARAIHEGRAKLEDELIKTLQRYARSKAFKLTLNLKQLDQHVLRATRFLHLPHVGALYDRIASGALSAQQLVHQIVRAELSALVVLLADDEQRVSRHSISFCGYCEPVPGEAIVGVQSYSRQGPRLRVHVRTCKDLGEVPSSVRVALAWSAPADLPGEQMVCQVVAEDRVGLLRDLLGVIADDPDANLYAAAAQVHDDGSADLSLTIGAPSLAHLSQIRAQIETSPGVRQVMLVPPTPTQQPQQHPLTSEGLQANPYVVDREVYGRKHFYNREREIDRLLRWIDAAPGLLALHGQRRVGKTSLVKHLAYGVLTETNLAHPVYIDLQGLALGRYDGLGLATYLVQHVYESFGLPVPPYDGTPPIMWLNRLLDAAVRLARNRKLVLMIDEFAKLIACEQRGQVEPLLFDNLCATLAQQRAIHCLLIVQESYYSSPDTWGGAAPLLQRAHSMPLAHLDRAWALRLIREPMLRSGRQFQSKAIPLRIAELSDGNPYIINGLCYELIERVRAAERNNVTDDDLDQVVMLMLEQGQRWFNHYLSDLTPLDRLALRAFHDLGGADGWVNRQELVARLEQQAPGASSRELHKSLEKLRWRGMLVFDEVRAPSQIQLPMGLFRRWIADNVDVDVAQREWLAHAPGAALTARRRR